eukprot:SM000075S21941  [mRNA]  locus=s75:158446:159770:- [translate_table: standard]
MSYRQVLRTARLFTWRNEQGVPWWAPLTKIWRDMIELSARREFELARSEQDPETIARMLVTGTDAVQAAIDKVREKRNAVLKEDPADSGSGHL